MCRELHILPNDPALRDLNPTQALWVVANMVRDAEQVRRSSALGRGGSGGSSEGGERTRIAEYELSDDEFAVFSRQVREQAEAEAARRKGA